MGLLCKMDNTGDTRITWFPDDEKEIKTAKKEFDKLKREGWSFFSVGKLSGEKDTMIKSFDPLAAQIIAVPPMKGG